MSLDDTQELKNTETISGTLVFSENKPEKLADSSDDTSNKNEADETNDSKSPSIIKNLKKMIANKVESNGEQLASKMSLYCLRLNTQNQLKHILDGPVTIIPLFLGMNTVGRSTDNSICIINKNLSKKHACIELTQKENGDLENCLIWDIGSLNKTKIKDKKDGLVKEEKYSLKLNEFVQFGVIRFDLVKMTDNQFKEQEIKPVKQVELDDNLFDYSAKKLNKSTANGESKLAKVLEIASTLDDTYLIESNESALTKEETNGKKEIVISDTEPEDNEEDDNNTTDFHLEMSASIINQSTYSTNQTRTSFIIPDTLASQEVEEVTNNKKETNGSDLKNGSVISEITTSITTTTDSTMVTVVPDTIIITDTQSVQEDKSQENNSQNEIKPSPVIELRKEEDVKQNGEVVTNKEEKTEKVESNCNDTKETEIKPIVVDESSTVNDEVNEAQKEESKPVVEDEKKEEEKTKEVEPKEVEEDNKEKEVIIESTLLENGDEKGADVSTVSIVIFDDNEKKEATLAENPAKTTVAEQETTESVEPVKTNRRGRRSKAAAASEETQSTVATDETNETNTAEASIERSSRRSTRVSLAPTTTTTTNKPIRSIRAKKNIETEEKSKEPEEPIEEIKEETTKVETKENKVVEEVKEQETKKEETKEEIKETKEDETKTEEVVLEEKQEKKQLTRKKKVVESTKEEETKEEETKNEEAPAEESKIGRRSSMRIKSNVQNSATLAREKLLKQQAEAKAKAAEAKQAEEEQKTTSKRKKSIEPVSAAKTNKKLKNLEHEESYHADEEEEETEKAEEKVEVTVKTKGRGRKAKETSAATLIEEEEEEIAEETKEEPQAKTKRTYNRRKTIAVDSSDLKEAAKETTVVASKKKTKATINISHVDTYLYEESSENENEQEKKLKANKRGANANLSLAETTETKNDNKRRKSKANESLVSKVKEAEHSETEATTAKRGRKRKSNEPKSNASLQQDSEDGKGTTPKLFFHSKNRNKTTAQTPTRSDGDSTNGHKKNTSINKPTYSAALNSSKNDTSLNTSVSLSPSKKFKLLKTKSSSSENLNNTISSSDDENEQTSVKKKTTPKQAAKSPVVNHNKKNVSFTEPKETVSETKEVESKTESVVEQSNDESLNESTTTSKGKKQIRLNSTLKEKSTKPAKETAKSRLSLQPTTAAPTRQTSRNLKGPNVVKIMTTGILLSEKQQKIVSDLGGQIVTDVKECTHLITNKIRRTYKFLSCLNRSTFILNERWLDECKKNGMLSNMATFGLKDAQFEKQHKFTLQTSLTKSKSNPLFKEWKFLIKCKDDDPEMTVDNIKTIIECGSGEVCESLPTNQEDLDQCCVIYDTIEDANSDKNEKVAKILLDNFLNCILKQTFDSSSFVQMDGSD